MAAPKGDSRERLLNSAEKLFAERGFDGTSTREITALSGDTLGTLSYHFGNKDRLFGEVVRRRFDELADMRRQMYRELKERAGGATPGIEDTITAIVYPFIRQAMCGGPMWESYISLVGRLMYSQNERLTRFTREVADPIGHEMMGWLKAAVPDAESVELAYAYQFIIGCMIDSASRSMNERTVRLSGGECTPFDFDAVSTRVIRFCCAGAKELLGMA
jgi:AcrR family transcriptional regulator